MNILYLTSLSGDMCAGPTYSVPKQIASQAKYDNVFWYNRVRKNVKLWSNIEYYHDLNEYPNMKIKDLPKPFNKPDLVIVEGFYNMGRAVSLMKELSANDIPYIIVPRCELTQKAQKRKKIKKIIGNLLMFNKFAENAAAIQYLTIQEKLDSGKKWNNKSIVVPNGTDIKKEKCTLLKNESIVFSYIGRIEKYQKGLDLLIEACALIKNILEKNNCKINIYGPDNENQKVELNDTINLNKLENIISIYPPVVETEKKKILLDSDVFIMTSRFEGHPMALVEALSYGVTCAITKGTNMKKEVELYDAGWTADTNVESIKQMLLQIIEEKELIKEKSKNAIELSKLYDWDYLAKKAHDEYIVLLKKIYCG